ncbi:hypothetical protein AQS8620_00282 [Aquimixticola soesokkakensis]|uniref:Cyclopropane-fatty-acyl-phospholipid synthase n=1 Tax=Aquimixticola soesokkakensis TaxID=1519096 RepID=A0A1Y5RFK2_9RHOB|nr:DUF1365 domain-containing protein [Aquimixticola soesokkakensis]SLN15435.1 hypothetical protein AQS8620_00282 [Aquimixticola soesokkakensis]
MQNFVPAHTFHKRHGAPRRGPANAFRYSVDYVLVDLAKSHEWPSLLRHNSMGLFQIRDRDHGGVRGNGDGLDWVHMVLAARGFDFDDAQILLLTQPRMAGYLFNPVSFWLVMQEGLRVVIAEVNNTMGERHSYICHHTDLRAIEAGDTLVAQKVFHVSPFQDVAGHYEFRFDLAEGHVGVRIDFRHDVDGVVGGLVATLAGPREALSNRALLHSMLRRPLGSLRATVLIHWQAIILALKGARFFRRPEPPEDEVTGGPA